MKVRSNLHGHSRYSDGADTLEEMVLAAIDKGFVSLGMSEHAFAPYDADCCITRENTPVYLAEMAGLKEKYAGQIELYTGLESDYYCPALGEGLDFTIGAVHYLRHPETGAYYTLDYLPGVLEDARDHIAGGDIRLLLELYYAAVIDVAESYRPDILGHIDLVTKLNGGGRFFDEDSGWYHRLMEDTAERIAASGCIVELNTGGIYRGYRQHPYPSRPFLVLLHALHVPMTISSDAHCAAALDFWFEEGVQLLQSVGYKTIKRLQGGSFIDVPL